MTIGGRAQKGMSLGNCFSAYEVEETLGGDDQMYCSACKEHRDINKKLQVYSTPKILIIQLRRFKQRRGNRNRTGMYGMYASVLG